MDAKTSDYIYKHHIARLEDIYTHRRFEINTPIRELSMSPTAQLYGIHGLKSSMMGGVKHRRKREQQWVGNFQKYQTLRENELPPRPSPSSASASDPTAGLGGNGIATGMDEAGVSDVHGLAGSLTGSLPNLHHPTFPLHHRAMDADDLVEDGHTMLHHVRRVQVDDSSPRCDLIAFGLYRLNPSQQQIYQQFVHMISRFDTEDMRRIAEDAVGEAYSDNVLSEYGGIDGAVSNAPAFAS